MTTGSILLGLALFIVLATLLARPFLEIDRARRAYISERHQLETEKEALLLQIQRLDFDHDTGKLPTPIYDRQRSVLVEEAAEVMKSLDNLKTKRRAPQGRSSEIEAAIARLRQGDSPAAVPAPAEVLTAAPAPARPPAAKGDRAFCPQCGNQVDRTDKFCAHCGHALQAAAKPAAGSAA